MVDTDADVDVCWVCLAPAVDSQPLVQACVCPRTVHKECLARWQLQSVGRSEETACRFCYRELPDWRAAYNLPTATPVMTVSHNNIQHLLEVKPGESGKLKFQQDIRRIFSLGPQDIIELTFGCKAPGTDQDVALKGWQSYEAAVHCAAISAGVRRATKTSDQNTARQQLRLQLGSNANSQASESNSLSSSSTAWSTSSPGYVQRTHSTESTHTSAQHDGVSHQQTCKDARTAARSSLLPALLQRLHAGTKRSRQDANRQ